jgi:hypothetical protein
LKNFAVAAAVGLIVGVLMVWWVRPATNPGTIFIVVVSTTLCVVLGTVVAYIGGFFRKI